MSLLESVLIIGFASILNGSFVIPARYMKTQISEQVWLFHSIIGMILLPWCLLFCISPLAMDLYFRLNFPEVLLLLIGGIVFGFGQISFLKSIAKIGIALSFTINLGIGVVVGSLFVVIDQHKLFTAHVAFILIAISLIVIGLIANYFSRKVKNTLSGVSTEYKLGWLLAMLAGFASGFQNCVFIMLAFYLNKLGNMDSFWVWPPFLTCASVPMIVYFYRDCRKRTMDVVSLIGNAKNILLLTMMGLFFSGSLALYSFVMSHLNHSQQLIGWPVFMTIIILTTQFWGFFYGEFIGISFNKKLTLFVSVLLFVAAIIILTMIS